MAEESGWNAVRLRAVAERLRLPLDEVAAAFRDLDAVADAWFLRLRDAMLKPLPAGFADRPAAERIQTVMMRWFEAAAPHRRVTAAMIRAKLYPSHPHHWVPLVFNLSRLIQWVREAARLDAGGRRRQVEEVGLTALFLATLAVWLRDGSKEQEATRRFLGRRLARADKAMVGLFGGRATRRPGRRAAS